MDREEHIKRHKELHASLDELMANMIMHTNKMPSKTTVMELMQWSHQQTIEPTEEEMKPCQEDKDQDGNSTS
jgi:hypothetical protein